MKADIERRIAAGATYRTLLAITSVLIVLASLTAVKRTVDQSSTASATRSQDTSGLSAFGANPGGTAAAAGNGTAAAEAAGAARARDADLGRASLGGGSTSPKRLARGLRYPIGVTDSEIKLVYYWKGDRTATSPYLRNADQEGNVDEGKAFRGLINYINKHPEGEFFGMPINLHGRKLTGIVLEAGQASDSYGFTAHEIVETHKPFAAIAAHGSLSTYICPVLAKAGIHNAATYDLGGNLARSTDGYCLPSGLAWERQVEFTERYLLKQQQTEYRGPEAPAGAERRYGVLYSEYPGLVEAAPKLIERFKKAGINIVDHAALSSSLTDAQRQVPGVVGKFRSSGVNTLIIPDAGAPLNFTHGAQTQGYHPDYYVWPCSGLDNTAMVRLYNAAQWSRAAGLTCYDEQFDPDLTNDDAARSSEWWQWYEEGTGSTDVPAPTALVAAGLFQILIGVTAAGPELTLENFRAGMDAFTLYRYDAVEGRTDDPTNMLLLNRTRDRSFIGDVAKLRWDNTARSSGSASQGKYVYPEKRRYVRAAAL